MREKIQLDQIRCERCVSRLAGELAPIEGISEARIEMGTSSIIIEYVEGAKPEIETAFKKGGFGIVDRHEMQPGTI